MAIMGFSPPQVGLLQRAMATLGWLRAFSASAASLRNSATWRRQLLAALAQWHFFQRIPAPIAEFRMC